MHTGYQLVWIPERMPDYPAIVDDFTGRQLSYRELIAEIDAVAAGLADRGINAGSRVATALPSTWEHCLAILALDAAERDTGIEFPPEAGRNFRSVRVLRNRCAHHPARPGAC